MKPAVSTPSTSTSSAVATDPFQHEALFYRDRDEYLAVTVPFIEGGLARDEPVLVAVPAANLDLLRAEVGEAGGRVSYADMSQAGRNPGRIIPYVLHAFIARHTPRSARVIGEPIWDGRSGDEYPACVQHEALINLAFTGLDVAIVCPYDVSALPADRVADAHRTHPVLADPGSRWASRAYMEPSALVAAFNKPLGPVPPDAVAVIFGADELAAIRDLAAEHAERAGLSERRGAQLQLAVNEIATNCVTHGNGPGMLRLWLTEGYLVAEINGGGRLRDPLAGRIPVPPRQPNGRGLLLVNEVCDLVRVHTSMQGTTTRLYMGRGGSGVTGSSGS
jgi:anti-sigma regulatory factor (Ser/Thr protein kinase)